MIFYLINKCRVKYTSILLDIIGIHLKQASIKINKINSILNKSFTIIKLPLILNIYIWLLITTVIINSFTGLLHNIYFNIKYIPCVERLDDIIRNKDLLIAGYLPEFAYAPDKLDTYNQLNAKFLKYYNGKVKYLFDRTIFDDVVNNKIALVATSKMTNAFEQNYYTFRDQFIKSEYASSAQFLAHTISKTFFCNDKITFM